MKKTTGPVIKFRKGEKIILLLILFVTILSPVLIVYSSSKLSSVNVEVQQLQKQIEEQENVNAGLSMQVDELASLSTIQDIAKENGLSYNNDNIVVVK
jgi:cell division protein FtsL